MTLAEHIVDVLLNEAHPAPIAVKIQRADGSIVDAEFNGWWDLTFAGKGMVPSVGFKLPSGRLTHGILSKEDKLLTPVPSPEEWSEMSKASSATPPAKATFWASSGSGAY